MAIAADHCMLHDMQSPFPQSWHTYDELHVILRVLSMEVLWHFTTTPMGQAAVVSNKALVEDMHNGQLNFPQTDSLRVPDGGLS